MPDHEVGLIQILTPEIYGRHNYNWNATLPKIVDYGTTGIFIPSCSHSN